MSTMQYAEYAVEPSTFSHQAVSKINKSSEYFYYKPTSFFFLGQNHNSIYATFLSITLV